MKLLFDQNISFRVVKGIQDLFPLAKQVRELGLENYSDREIWDYAKKEAYTIVTFDSDFFDMNLVLGSPPRIIWLRIGNASTDDIIDLFRKNFELIKEFLSDPDYSELGCLEIGKDIFEA
jgi:predicted nuclease of predicted toxin-antitoxin system